MAEKEIVKAKQQQYLLTRTVQPVPIPEHLYDVSLDNNNNNNINTDNNNNNNNKRSAPDTPKSSYKKSKRIQQQFPPFTGNYFPFSNPILVYLQL